MDMSESNMPGLGVMIGMLAGNEDVVAAVTSAVGRTIARAVVLPDVHDGTLRLTFTDGAILDVWDDGRSCCESRYLATDDDLGSFVGDILTAIELADAPEIADEYGVHEQQFVKVRTNRGVMTLVTHNEHNGYYGGFWMNAHIIAAKATP